jgi:hypothetical protein
MVTEIVLFESPNLTSLRFGLLCWMKIIFYKRQVDTRQELIFRMLDAAVHIKKCEDQLRRATRDFRT